MTTTPAEPTLAGRLYAQAAQFRAEVEAMEQGPADAMLLAWLEVYEQAKADLDQVLAKVEKARQEGTRRSPAWQLQQAQATQALEAVRRNVDWFAQIATEQTTEAKREAIALASQHAPRLVTTATGREGITGTFDQGNPQRVEALTAFLADGTPLAELFATMGDDATAEARRVLTRGVATGKSTDWMARRLAQALDVPRWRAETIARTEVQRVYREVTRAEFLAQADTLAGWVWTAALDARTCPACMVMHGTLHPLSATLDGHPRCRCAMVPKAKSWADLGIEGLDDLDDDGTETGADWFARQPEATQAAILGPAKYRAWRAGEIALDDLVARTEDPAWGTMRRERSLREIREGRHPDHYLKALASPARA